MSLKSEVEAVRAKLERATYRDGEPVRVVLDPNHIDTPCIYVPVPNLTFRMQQGQADGVWEAFCCGTPNADTDTLTTQHAEMLDALARLGLPLIDAQLYDLPVLAGSSTIAYRVTWNAHRLTIGD